MRNLGLVCNVFAIILSLTGCTKDPGDTGSQTPAGTTKETLRPGALLGHLGVNKELAQFHDEPPGKLKGLSWPVANHEHIHIFVALKYETETLYNEQIKWNLNQLDQIEVVSITVEDFRPEAAPEEDSSGMNGQ